MTSILFLIDNIYYSYAVISKTKNFSQFFSAFLKYRLNFQHIQKKATLIANLFPKFRNSKNMVRFITKEYLFRVPLEEQHGKLAQTLSKFEQQHLSHIY